MITLSSIVTSARAAFPGHFEIHYIHPTLYLVCKDESFASLDDNQRLDQFSQRTGLPVNINTLPTLASNLSVLLITQAEREREYDFLDASSSGHHWLPLFDPETFSSQSPVKSSTPCAVHFYGYKGGQARSTVLAMLAKQLADDGYRVLAVDADIEAPSLDVLLNVAASGPNETLMGLLDPEQPISPLSAYTAISSGGQLDLLACRPTSSNYNMDFAAFVLRSALDVSALEEGLKRLANELSKRKDKNYDVVLFDHRSGLATSVLPVVKAYPGPAVICLRIDEQSRSAGPLFDILLNQVTDTPGAYVSFSLDPEESRDRLLGTHGARISELLDRLGAAIKRGSNAEPASGEELPPENFLRYWVSWFHDRAFLTKPCPAIADISEQNRRSLLQLREVLALSERKSRPSSARAPTRSLKESRLSPSGAGDEGIFIETQDIARLFQANTPITYIFGRKGTGKTRLLRELHDRKLGEPLVVAADASGGGLSSGDTLFTDLAERFAKSPEKLWWCILGAALETGDTTSTRFRKQLAVWGRRAQSKNVIRTTEIAALAAAMPNRRVFLIDGIETAFRATQLIEFVEALFKFLLTVQSDSQFVDKVVVRLFLRTDLAKRAIQNVEQQTSGRTLDLSWNTQSIFNFVLSRIAQLNWFKENFAECCAIIDKENDRVRAGLLTSSEYEPLLLEIFPRHLRRNNLQTLTFLKTYFSDAAGDDEVRAAFYPRLFDAFLQFVAHPDKLPHGKAPQSPMEEGRVSQSLVLAAHEAASRKFLEEVKQELSVLLDLSKKSAENEQRVSELLAAFDGLSTPFELDDCLKKLSDRVPKVKAPNLREALHRMKEVGMFEDRPGFSGWWRAGRLFKSALRMKYVRRL